MGIYTVDALFKPVFTLAIIKRDRNFSLSFILYFL